MAERAGVSAPINLRGKLRTSAVAGVLGGLVFGYAAGVIAAAGLQLTAQFNLSAVQMSLVASALLVGGLVGAMLVGRLEQRYSTRSLLAVAASVAAVGALLSAVVSTDSIGPLIATRVVIGFGIGIISVSAPRYLSEISPSAVRGSRVATFQLMICVGFLVSYFSGLLFAGPGGWRLMFAVTVIPCAALVVLLLRSTQTPTDLYRSGRHDELTELLAAMEPDSDPGVAAGELVATLDAPQLSWREVLSPRRRWVLILGLVFAVGQILTGINAIMYFAPQIFSDAGFTSATAAIVSTIIVGVVNVLATFVAIRYIDRFGRRPLLIVGLTIMVASGVTIAAVSATMGTGGVAGYITLVAVLMFVASFAMSMGPVTWVLIGELFPPEIRDKAMSLALSANWGTNLVLSLAFLPLMQLLGTGVVFAGFAVINVALLVFVVRRLPETRGLTLTEIGRLTATR